MIIPALAAVAIVAYMLGGSEPENLPGADPIPPTQQTPTFKKKRNRKKK